MAMEGARMSQKSHLNINRTTRDISRLAIFVNDRKTEKKVIKDNENKDQKTKQVIPVTA